MSQDQHPAATSASLTRLGSIVGSGGMIVMDQDTDMVDMARFFMEFCRDESCGQCIPCRAGTVQMDRLLRSTLSFRWTFTCPAVRRRPTASAPCWRACWTDSSRN